MKPAAIGLLSFLCASTSLPATAAIDYVAVVNAVRLGGCGPGKSADEAVISNKDLDAAARLVADGEGLLAAARSSGYLARNTASIRIRNVDDRSEAEAVLARRFCDIVTDAGLADIGIYTRGRDVWMLLAGPLGVPAADESPATLERVLRLVNEARAAGRTCGREEMPAAPSLRPSPALALAAQAHAEDMATHSFLGHEGSDGSMPAERVSRAGYDWRAVAENVAAGQADAESVVATWLESPGHCSGLMSAKYSETGIAFVVDAASDDSIYWVQVFGARD